MILCYDVGVKRNNKVRKTVRKYLRPVQRSVFEGFITEGKLRRLCDQLKELIDPEEDAITLYKMNAGPDFEKSAIGQTMGNEDFIL